MEANTDTHTAGSKEQVLMLKPVIRIPMSAFRPTPEFIERRITAILSAANSAKDGSGRRLNELLRSWADADCNLEKWAYANPDKFQKLRQTCDDWRVTPFDGAVPQRGKFKPVLQGAIGLEAGAETPDHAEEQVAYGTFAAFVLTSGTVVRIGVCDRCKKLYWNRWGHANKRFCGRKCSQLQTATEGQARKLANRRREKNKKVRQALKAFIDIKPTVTDWRPWVASRAGVTQSYLTRTLNRGREDGPDGLKLTKAQIKYLESKGESHHANL